MLRDGKEIDPKKNRHRMSLFAVPSPVTISH